MCDGQGKAVVTAGVEIIALNQYMGTWSDMVDGLCLVYLVWGAILSWVWGFSCNQAGVSMLSAVMAGSLLVGCQTALSLRLRT